MINKYCVSKEITYWHKLALISAQQDINEITIKEIEI